MSPNAHRPEPVAPLAPNRMTARDQVSAVGEEVCSGCVEATRERGRLLLADFGSATASFLLFAARDFEDERDLVLLAGDGAATASLVTSADFDAARDRLRAGFASEPRSTSAGAGATIGDAAGAVSAVDLRPRPNSFANVERLSE
jgi:hypothetical protein